MRVGSVIYARVSATRGQPGPQLRHDSAALIHPFVHARVIKARSARHVALQHTDRPLRWNPVWIKACTPAHCPSLLNVTLDPLAGNKQHKQTQSQLPLQPQLRAAHAQACAQRPTAAQLLLLCCVMRVTRLCSGQHSTVHSCLCAAASGGVLACWHWYAS